jgi:2-phospho-L-lactate guanylyltransferase
LDQGKSRLSDVLTPQQRTALCIHLLERTLYLASQLTVKTRIAVVSDDDEVWRRLRGATIIVDPGRGLNLAVTKANNVLLGDSGKRSLLILPIDLPLSEPDDFNCLASGDADVQIAADKSGTGTNILLLSLRARQSFQFAYGMCSVQRHARIAAERQLTFSIVRHPRLSFDIDTPADWLQWQRHQAHCSPDA